MRRALGFLYAASGVLAAFFMVAMAALVVLQIGARFVGTQVPSADDFARLSMAASAFLGLAFALRTGAHIRVMLVFERLPAPTRRAFEIACLALSAAVSAWFAWATGVTAWESWSFGEFTIGPIPIPKWIPLAGMCLGIALVAIAFADDLVEVLRGRPASYERPSEFQNTEG
jgi:TRAP-type C4-dicarboxylate transport system permease small subunit